MSRPDPLLLLLGPLSIVEIDTLHCEVVHSHVDVFPNKMRVDNLVLQLVTLTIFENFILGMEDHSFDEFSVENGQNLVLSLLFRQPNLENVLSRSRNDLQTARQLFPKRVALRCFEYLPMFKKMYRYTSK